MQKVDATFVCSSCLGGGSMNKYDAAVDQANSSTLRCEESLDIGKGKTLKIVSWLE